MSLIALNKFQIDPDPIDIYFFGDDFKGLHVFPNIIARTMRIPWHICTKVVASSREPKLDKESYQSYFLQPRTKTTFRSSNSQSLCNVVVGQVFAHAKLHPGA